MLLKVEIRSLMCTMGKLSTIFILLSQHAKITELHKRPFLFLNPNYYYLLYYPKLLILTNFTADKGLLLAVISGKPHILHTNGS